MSHRSLILPRYVIRSALLAMTGAVLGLWLLQTIFSYLSELENITDSYTLKDALYYIFYRSPYFLVEFIPTGALLGAVIGLGLLANNSELIVMRAAGLSLYRIIGWVMLPATLFVLLALGVNQFVLPTANQYANAVKTEQTEQRLITINGYWSVNQIDNRQEVVYISRATNQGELGEVKRYDFMDGNLTGALRAGSGTYQPDEAKDSVYTWRLNDIDEVAISSLGVDKAHSDERLLSLPIAPKDVHLLTREPEDLSLTDLVAHRQLMKYQGSRSLRHELAFWQKLLSPFAILSLVQIYQWW